LSPWLHGVRPFQKWILRLAQRLSWSHAPVLIVDELSTFHSCARLALYWRIRRARLQCRARWTQ